jgi:hypothetical protein
MAKIDLKKQLRDFYSAPRKPEIVDVPVGRFLTHTGKGEPGGRVYGSGVGALYGLSYALKFMSKARGNDYAVMPLEGLWWWDDPSIIDIRNAPPRHEWNFKSMIRQPDFVDDGMLEAALPKAREKSGRVVDEIRLEDFHEGLSAQIMHVGPYSDEGSTVATLRGFIEDQGCSLRGHHHEIYLGDPRRTAPERLKTIIRQPIERS